MKPTDERMHDELVVCGHHPLSRRWREALYRVVRVDAKGFIVDGEILAQCTTPEAAEAARRLLSGEAEGGAT